MLIKAACIIQKDYKDIKFIVIGEGTEKENLVSEIEKKHIENINI